jgi:L-ascorbate metabolism protein UlaG (beta-lactamase superfamily)
MRDGDNAVVALPRVSFLGHSTALVEIDGLRVLTDPVLFDRVTFLRRVASSVDPDLHADVDVAVVSHLHLDHFDMQSLRLLGPQTRFVVPAGAARLVRAAGLPNVEELAPGEEVEIGGVTFRATPAQHGGYRPPFGPRAAAVGYLLEGAASRLYFAGDTDLFPEMQDLSDELDVALLPVWGYGPTLGPGHLDPTRAAQALQLLRPRFAVPIHWGTLWPYGLGRVRPHRLTQPPLQFASHAAETRPEAKVLVTPPGESVDLPR